MLKVVKGSVTNENDCDLSPTPLHIMIFLTWLAWTTESILLKWSAYLTLGYLWMGIVTFMHDATHNTLFGKP